MLISERPQPQRDTKSAGTKKPAAALQDQAWPLAALMPIAKLDNASLPERDFTSYLDVYDSADEAQAFLAEQDAALLTKVIAAADALHAYISAAFTSPPPQVKLRLRFPGKQAQSAGQLFAAFTAAYESLPEGAVKEACKVFEKSSHVAQHLATACHAAAACAAAGETGPTADAHYAKMRDALRVACAAADYPTKHLPILRLKVRIIPEKFKTAMQGHYTSGARALHTGLEALQKQRSAAATHSFGEDDELLRAALTNTSMIPTDVRTGDAIVDGGIYLREESYKTGDLCFEFHVVAAPTDLGEVKTYTETARAISKLRGWHGHDGLKAQTQDDFWRMLKRGEYAGQWIPPFPNSLDAQIKHQSTGEFAGTYGKQQIHSGLCYWAFQVRPDATVYNKHLGGKNYTDGADDYRQSCRPVRLVPVDPEAYAQAVAKLKASRRRTLMVSTVLGTGVLAAALFTGMKLLGSIAAIPAEAPTRPTTSEAAAPAKPAAARTPWYIHP